MIPHSRPIFGSDSQQAVAQVLRSGHAARGSVSESLEQRVAGLTGMPFAAAVDSGSSALMLALFALASDRTITRVGIPAYACRALLHAVRAVGALPVFMDCKADLRLDEQQAGQIAPTLDAVILVHPFGMIEPMVADDWPCPVIEDIAQAPGGSLHGRALGGFGDVAVASFYVTKPWGGAYGGMVLSRREEICERVRDMRYADTAGVELPYAGNHQLSDVHAALAMCRIDAAPLEVQRRRKQAAKLDGWLAERGLQSVPCGTDANHFRHIVRVPDADASVAALRAHGVGAALPVDVPLSRLLGEHCPGAETARRECVSLPLLSAMSAEEEETMQHAIRTCL